MIGSILVLGRILRDATSWYHSSGEVLTDEKKEGVATIGRCGRARGT